MTAVRNAKVLLPNSVLYNDRVLQHDVQEPPPASASRGLQRFLLNKLSSCCSYEQVLEKINGVSRKYELGGKGGKDGHLERFVEFLALPGTELHLTRRSNKKAETKLRTT